MENDKQIEAAIAYFEDAIRESDEIIADCTPALQAELEEQKGYFAVALEAMRRAPLPEDNPLTVEDLRGMDGEPVWVEYQGKYPESRYGIVEVCEERVNAGRNGNFYFDCRDNWLAYRRPPEKGE